MTYGYDEAQLFPVRSLYDTGMINQYIQSVQREYERGLADQKEFISKYGDFTSPIARDIEAWDQATVGSYNMLIQELQKQGIDPVRSQEGRAAINRFIMSRPYGDMAKLRQSAEAAKKYQDMAGQLKAKGLYSQELEDFMGVGNLGTWDTLHNGMWSNTSPTEFKDLNQLTSHWFDGLKPSYLGQKDKYHKWYGVSDEAMDKVLDSRLSGFLGTQLGQYYLSQSGGNLDQLKQNIKAANSEVLNKTEVTDDVALKLAEMAQSNRQHRESLRAQRLHSQSYSKTPKPSHNYLHNLFMNGLSAVTGNSQALSAYLNSEQNNSDYTKLLTTVANNQKNHIYGYTTASNGKATRSWNKGSLSLAIQEPDTGFNVRFEDRDRYQVTKKTGDKKNGSSESIKTDYGFTVSSSDMKHMYTLQDVSQVAYGAVRVKNRTPHRNSSGVSKSLTKQLGGKTVKAMRPAPGDNYIVQLENDGKFRNYRKVILTMDGGSQLTAWYSYGEVDYVSENADNINSRYNSKSKITGGTNPAFEDDYWE